MAPQQPYHIVVAHFNEDLEWLTPFDKETLIIYSKGTLATVDCIQKVLPNVGRESHTYLSYILEYYDNLPNIVFFTQGSIREHMYFDQKDYIQQKFLLMQANSSDNYTVEHFNYGLDPDWHLAFCREFLARSPLSGKDFFKTYINPDIDLDSPIRWYGGAIFSVKREAILSRSKEYYKTLLDTVSENNAPETGHFLERSWYYIFNNN